MSEEKKEKNNSQQSQEKPEKKDKRKRLSNIRVDYAKLQTVLIYVACGLIIAISLFYIIFNEVNIATTKARIEQTEKRIEQLNYYLANIDEYNEEYVTDKLMNQYDRSMLVYALSELWSYELYINGELLTNENYHTLCDVDEGEEVEILLKETMQENSIPFKLASKGNSRQGDPNDELKNYITIASVITFNYSGDSTLKEESRDDRIYRTYEGSLTYKFVKGQENVVIRIFPTLGDKLDLPEKDDIGFYYVLTLR
jgi:cell division protein FtsL